MIKSFKHFRFYGLFLFVLSGFLGISLLRSNSSEFNLKNIEAQVEQRYPEINHISVTTLEQWLNSSNPPILLDVRESEEYGISHLKGAYLVSPNTPIDQVISLLKKYPSQKVVVYCSVGMRSSQLAQKLQQAGIESVYNFKGSIFAWANQGRPLYQGKNQVFVVHPYDNKWGQLLKPKYRANWLS